MLLKYLVNQCLQHLSDFLQDMPIIFVLKSNKYQLEVNLWHAFLPSVWTKFTNILEKSAIRMKLCLQTQVLTMMKPSPRSLWSQVDFKQYETNANCLRRLAAGAGCSRSRIINAINSLVNLDRWRKSLNYFEIFYPWPYFRALWRLGNWGSNPSTPLFHQC